MSPEFKYFLIFDGIIVLLLLLWIFRRDKYPRMRAKKFSGSSSPRKITGNRAAGPLKRAEAANLEQNGQHSDRSLTLFFNYNGHSFEAFESLGIPAGSSFETAKIAYEKGSSQIDAESREFLKAALEAIRKNQA